MARSKLAAAEFEPSEIQDLADVVPRLLESARVLARERAIGGSGSALHAKTENSRRDALRRKSLPYLRKNKNAESGNSRRCALTGGSPESSRSGKAPRGVLNSNRGFVELGSYALNRLRRKPTIEFFPWNVLQRYKKAGNDSNRPARDPLRLARYYQSLIDSGKFESRAALARFLGVSRARVTQVLNRLQASPPVVQSNSVQVDDSVRKCS